MNFYIFNFRETLGFPLIVIQRRIIITLKGLPFPEDAHQLTSFDSYHVPLAHHTLESTTALLAGSLVIRVLWLSEFFYFNYVTLPSNQFYEVVAIKKEQVYRG